MFTMQVLNNWFINIKTWLTAFSVKVLEWLIDGI